MSAISRQVLFAAITGYQAAYFHGIGKVSPGGLGNAVSGKTHRVADGGHYPLLQVRSTAFMDKNLHFIPDHGPVKTKRPFTAARVQTFVLGGYDAR